MSIFIYCVVIIFHTSVHGNALIQSLALEILIGKKRLLNSSAHFTRCKVLISASQSHIQRQQQKAANLHGQ